MKPTPAQQEAIDSYDSNLLLIAGAGSGKTATVIQRIKCLIERGVNPASILCLTFTRKAAMEMRERLEKMLGARVIRPIWIGTFHSISYRILSQWGYKIGYKVSKTESISVTSPEEADTLLKAVLDQYDFRTPMKKLMEAKGLLSHDNIKPTNPDIERVLREYKSRLKESNAVDFDYLLLEVHALFEACPEALKYYQEKFAYIFVDEYQDTDIVQYNLHEKISPRNLLVVGDADQSLYNWRGARIEIILDFDKTHPDAKVIKLEHCFRCGDKIVAAANTLIEHNQNRIKKTLIGATQADGRIDLFNESNAEQIARFLAEEMAFEPPSEIAVIARNHRALELIERACREYKLDVLRVGKATNEVEAMDCFKFMVAYLKLRLNPLNNIAFLTANNVGFRTILPEIWKQANEIGCSWYQAFADQAIVDHEQPIVDFYRACCGRSNQPMNAIVLDYLEAMFDEGISAEDWLKQYQLKDSQLELEKKKDGMITLITAHAAKGLEWNNVIIADFDELAFPSNIAIKNNTIEEERRLAYVAFTRARQRLSIFYNAHKPSRFLLEANLNPAEPNSIQESIDHGISQ